MAVTPWSPSASCHQSNPSAASRGKEWFPPETRPQSYRCKELNATDHLDELRAAPSQTGGQLGRRPVRPSAQSPVRPRCTSHHRSSEPVNGRRFHWWRGQQVLTAAHGQPVHVLPPGEKLPPSGSSSVCLLPGAGAAGWPGARARTALRLSL